MPPAVAMQVPAGSARRARLGARLKPRLHSATQPRQLQGMLVTARQVSWAGAGGARPNRLLLAGAL